MHCYGQQRAASSSRSNCRLFPKPRRTTSCACTNRCIGTENHHRRKTGAYTPKSTVRSRNETVPVCVHSEPSRALTTDGLSQSTTRVFITTTQAGRRACACTAVTDIFQAPNKPGDSCLWLHLIGVLVSKRRQPASSPSLESSDAVILSGLGSESRQGKPPGPLETVAGGLSWQDVKEQLLLSTSAVLQREQVLQAALPPVRCGWHQSPRRDCAAQHDGVDPSQCPSRPPFHWL